MKKILRIIIVILFLLFTWWLFLYKKYGNGKNELKKRTIIICNHYSTFDPFFIYLLFKKKMYFVTIIETKKKLLTRFLTWLFECIYIDCSKVNVQYFKKCIKILENDGIICLFPEGIVNTRKYGFFDFYKSYLHIAKRAKANILPLYLYPELRALRKSKIYIGRNLDYDFLNKYHDYEELNCYIEAQIMEYSNNVGNS